MRPLDNVLVLPDAKLEGTAANYKGSAGVIEKVELDKNNEVAAVVVDMDIDHARVSFPPAALRILRA
jgi:hypothetical protein